MKRRNYHQLSIVRRESVGATRVVPNRRRYRRKVKHPQRIEY